MTTSNGTTATIERDWDLGRAKRSAELAENRLRAARANAAATVLENGRKMAIGDFDAAKRSRVRPGPRPRGGSADSHRDRPTLDALRRDCQSLLRNDKLARSMVKRLCDYVVGDAVRIQVKSSDAAFNTSAEAWIRKYWCSGVEHQSHIGPDGRMVGRGGVELCRLAVKSAMGAGGMLTALTKAGQVQCIEYERLRSPGGNDRNPAIVNGVEYANGGNGPVVAYHIARWDTAAGRAYPEMRTQAISAEYVLNLANPVDDEVNVTIPEPGLTALIDDFSTIRNYIKDTQLASRMATFFGLVTETQYPQDFALQMPGSSVTVSQNDGSTTTQREIEIEPGFAAHLQPGESIKQIDPKHPTTVFGDFVMTNLVLVGAESGLPLCLWMLDMTKVNFASARCAVLLAWATINVWRRWLRERFVIPLIRWRLAMAIRAGEIPGVVPMDWDNLAVNFPPMPVLDPLMQYQAAAYANEKRLKTHRDVWEEFNGGDYDEGMEQIAAEQQQMRDLDIMPVGQPGQFDPNIGRGKDASPTNDGSQP